MRAADIADQLTTVLVTEEEIHAKLEELARRVEADYEGRDLTAVLAAATAGGASFEAAGQPQISGYFLAGSAVGGARRAGRCRR